LKRAKTGARERTRENVADRIYDGFVDAIVTGRLGIGAKLPTMQRIAEEHGVTFRVARAIVERLGREGYVCSRPHSGTVVRAKKHTIWRGRILFVSFEDDCASYYVSRFADALRRLFVREGYLMTAVAASRAPRGDVSQLKTALGQSVDFVVIMYASKHIERLVAAAGCPYVVGCGHAASRPNAWSVPYDVTAAVDMFVEHCRKKGVKSVTEVRFKDGETSSVAAPLKAIGVRVRQMMVQVLEGCGRYEGIERGAMAHFLALKRSEFPDLFLFWDDFVAQGALMALLARGVRVPESVSVVVQSNKGLGPVFPISLTRFECDGAAAGEQVARFVLGVLAKGRVPPVPRVSPTYIIGRTFPWIET